MSTDDASPRPVNGAPRARSVDAPVSSVPARLRPLGVGAEVVLHVLAAGFYVTLWGLVGALVGLTIWFASDAAHGTGLVPGWALAFWCAFTALFLVLAQFGLGRRRGAGLPLEREAAPALFELLDDVARRMGLGPVSAVRLKPGPVMAAARVSRTGRVAVTSQRALVIGLPLFRALDEDDLRAAVAHELAHVAGGDLRRGRIVHAAWRRIALIRAVLERGRGPARWMLTWLNPVWWYAVGYGALLRRGAGVVRRRQEARADRFAADVVGESTYARSLVRIAEVGLAFRRLGPGLIVRAAESGARVENVYRDLSDALDGLSVGARRRLLRDALAEHDEEATDHPPLTERLDVLGTGLPEPEQKRARRAVELVPGLEELEKRLTPVVLRGLARGLGPELRRRRELRRTAASATTDA